MNKRLLSQKIRNTILALIAFAISGSSLLAQTASYKCFCSDALPEGVIEFQIIIFDDETPYTGTNISGLYSSYNPQIPIPDGVVFTPVAGATNQYELTGFAISGGTPFITIKGNDGVELDMDMISCKLPTASLSTASTSVCAGERIRVALDVDALGLDNSSIMWSSSGTATISPFANNLMAFVDFPNAGSFALSVSGETSAGCPFNADLVFNVTDVSENYTIQGPDYLCINDASDVSFTINNPDGLGIEWISKLAGGGPGGALFTPGTGSGSMNAATGSGTAVDVTFPGAGEYILCVSNANPNMCTLSNVEHRVTVVEKIDTISVIGDCYICIGEQGSYSIANPGDYTGLTWTVSPTTGTTMIPTSGVSDEVLITYSQTGTYTVMVSGGTASGCPFMSTMEVVIPDNIGSIACNNTVNVSLNNDCELELLPDMILEGGDNKSEAYTLEIFDATIGEVLTSNMITQDQLGHSFMVTVTERCGGNSCWGNLVVEDKSITPLGQYCDGGTVYRTCFDFDDSVNPPGFPNFPADVVVTYNAADNSWLLVGFDNCSDAILTYEDENTSADPCSDPQTITRTWTVTDANNGATSSCSVMVEVDLVDFGSIEWPPNYDSGLDADAPGDMDTDNTFQSLSTCPTDNTPHANLFCGDFWTEDDNGNPSPDCTGRPVGLLCTNLQVIGYTDQVIPICGSAKKILRKWTIWDSCANKDVMHTQIITIMDTTKPVCNAPTEGVRYTDTHECGATIFVDAPLIAGECDGYTYTVKYKLRDGAGFIPATFSDDGVMFDTAEDKYKIVDLPFDSDTVWIQYIVRDDCGNETSECFNEYELIDDEQPIPSCDLWNSVALDEMGMAFAGPGTFDDNSWDNCGVYQTVIQRMDTNGCDCKDANFDFMHTLGEYNGHYYYLSKVKKPAHKAFDLSAALDGYPVVINTQAENDWLRAQADLFGANKFIIGLSGITSGSTVGGLVWTGDTSSFTNWDASENEPDIDFINAKGDVHVYVGSDGSWGAERRNAVDAYYIVEREERCGWSQKVKFCCSDVGQETMVAVRVIDHYGNHNLCMVNVNVIDFLGPQLTCPANITVDCDEDFDINDSLSQYGSATATDQCSATVTELDPTFSGRDCGEGTITRTFSAVDPGGNTVSCTQTVTLENDRPFSESNIRWPGTKDLFDNYCSLEDIDPSVTGVPTLSGGPCTNAHYTYEDLLFLIVDGDVCQKLVRTWTVVDWCQPNTLWTHDQIIKLTNTVGPEFSASTCASETLDGELVGTCMVQIDSLFGALSDVANNCAESANWSFTIDHNTDGSVDRSGNSNDASGVFPYGTHRITWTVTDDCKNTSTCTKSVTIQDNKAPTPYCHSQIVIPISDTLGVEIWASDLDLGAYDDCPGSDIFLSFEENTLVTNFTLDCDDLDPGSNFGYVEVQLWVWDDENPNIANKSYCTVEITVQDNKNICDNIGVGTLVKIEGSVTTEDFEMIENVEMTLMMPGGQDQDMATAGEYAFGNVASNEDYMVQAFKDDNYLNGVSTLDLVIIQRHILGIEALDSPYKIIAADADNSESISAIDLIEIRKLILGIYETLPKNFSWRFVEEDFQFVDPIQPWPFSEVVDIQNVNADMLDADFMGVKIGDVNGSVTLNFNSTETESRSLNAFEVELVELPTGKGNTRVQFIAKEATDLAGMQFDLSFDKSSTELMAAIPMLMDINQSNISWKGVERGELKMSWNSNDVLEVAKGDVLIELLFEGEASDVELMISEKSLKSEAYTLTNGALSISKLAFDNIKANTDFDFAVQQNSPNPFNDKTVVDFTLPHDADVTLTVTDQNGRLILTQNNRYESGDNAIVIDAKSLGMTGILYYQIATETHTSTKKMIVIQ